jgi:uncharacterized delta-60 repeat protein
MPTRRFLAFVVPFLAVLAGGLAVPAGADPNDGTPDPSFGSGGARVFAWNQGGALADWVYDVVADDNGNLFLVGSFDSSWGDDDWGILELNAAGNFVNWQLFVFDLGGANTDLATGVRLDGAGGLLIAGQARTATGAEVRLCRLKTSDLTLDLTFGSGGCAAYSYLATGLYAVALARAGDGGWLVAGTLGWGSGNTDFFVVKFTSAGLLDTNFNWLDFFHPGMATVGVDLVAGGYDVARAIAVDHQGRVLVAGDAQAPTVSNAAAVVRLTASGERDWSFGASGLQTWTYFDGLVDHPAWASSLAVDPVLDTFLVGYSHYSGDPSEVAAAVGHFNAGGNWQNFPGGGSPIREVTWQPGGSNWMARVLVQCNGRILAVGDSFYGGTYQATRLLPNGTVDASYGVAGTASFSPSLHGWGSGNGVASATLSAGRLVLAGTVSNPNDDWLAVRLTSDLIFCDGFESVP